MTQKQILERLHFDKALISMNPYFLNNEYEEKGVLVVMKIEKDSDFDLTHIEDLCFQCPTFESHEDLIQMVLFLFDREQKIYDYKIAASKYKVSRSDILKFEKQVGIIID